MLTVRRCKNDAPLRAGSQPTFAVLPTQFLAFIYVPTRGHDKRGLSRLRNGDITTGLTGVPGVWVDRFPFYKYTKNCDEFAGDKFLCDPTDCAENIPDKTCAQLIEEYPDDMWSRPTLFQDRSLFSNTTYTLKRIVLGDGSKHPVFWDEFMRHMTKHEKECPWWDLFGKWCEVVGSHEGEKEMQSYRSDDWCSRKHNAVWGWHLLGC